MSDPEIVGIVSKKTNKYLLTADDGTQYQLLAIDHMESLPKDLYNEKFAKFIGEKVKVTGRIIDKIIWNALVKFSDEKNNLPPSLDDLLIKD